MIGSFTGVVLWATEQRHGPNMIKKCGLAE
jgi:hypothetical protein